MALPRVVGRHLARHRAGDERHAAGRHRRRQQHGRRREVRVRRAPAAALAAVVALRAAVEGLREDRQPRRDARDVQPLGRLLDRQLVAARLRRRHEDAVRLVRQVALGREVRAEDADEPIELVVVRLQVVVRDRPVVAEAVHALPAEVVRSPAQRDPAPVVRAAAEHPRAIPVPLLPGRDGVRLALELPPADAPVELAEVALGGRRPAPRRLVRPPEHRRIGRRIPFRAGLEDHDARTRLGEHLGGHAPAGARAHDAHVIRVSGADDLHESGSPAGAMRARYTRCHSQREAGRTSVGMIVHAVGTGKTRGQHLPSAMTDLDGDAAPGVLGRSCGETDRSIYILNKLITSS